MLSMSCALYQDNLSGRIKEKKSVLQKQRDYLRYYISLMSSAREFSSHSLVHSMPAEFIGLTNTITTRLNELKDQHLDACPLENSYVTFDRNAMGPDFKNFVLGMGQIRSTAIYPPKTSVETLEAPLGQESEVIRVFLYDAKGRPQRDSFDAISVEIKGNFRKQYIEHSGHFYVLYSLIGYEQLTNHNVPITTNFPTIVPP